MAVLYQAQLVPSKTELLSAWLPLQPWFAAITGSSTFDAVGAFRFDDPNGEVGIETHLLRSIDGQVLQVPPDLSGRTSGWRRGVVDHLEVVTERLSRRAGGDAPGAAGQVLAVRIFPPPFPG